MKKEDIIYINFPISLLKNAFIDIKNTVDIIFGYAVYKHSQTLEYGDELAKMKAAAKFFKINFGDIQKTISCAKDLQTNRLYDLKTPNVSINSDILWDFYKNKKTEFDIACFCAFCAIKSILGSKEYVKSNKGMVIARMFGDAKQNVKIEYPDEFRTLTDAANYILIKYEYHTNPGALSNAYKSGALKGEVTNNKTAPDIIKRDDLDIWYKTNIDKTSNTKNLNSALIEKYSKRYHIDAVLQELQFKWNLKLYSDHSRGFYLSFSKSLDDLAVINELAKNTTKYSELIKKKQSAKEAALKKLGL